MNTTFLKILLCAALAGAVWTGTGCTGGDGDDDGGSATSATDGGPDTSMCADYCTNVMDCAGGWGGGGQQYVSHGSCVGACVDFVEEGGGCGGAAESYFSCGAAIDDCDDYGTLHDSQCSNLEDSFEGWCLP